MDKKNNSESQNDKIVESQNKILKFMSEKEKKLQLAKCLKK